MVGVPGLFKLAVIHISYQAELIFLYVINRKIIGVDIAEFSRCISRLHRYSLIYIAVGCAHYKRLAAFSHCTVADQHIPYASSVGRSRFESEWHIAVV